MKFRPLLAALALAVTAQTGCDLAPPVERAAGSDLTRPLVRAYRAPVKEETPIAEDTKARLKQLEDLLVEFLQNHETALDRPDADQYLDQFEQYARWTGRYLELIDTYKLALDRRGPSHYAGPRLVLAYMNLGQPQRARQLLEEIKTARPDDARVVFLDGYLISGEQRYTESLARVVRNRWLQALEKDPALKNLYPIDAKVIRERIVEINRALGENITKAPPAPEPAPEKVEPIKDGDAPAEELKPTESLSDMETQLLEAKSLLTSGNPKEAYPAFQRILVKEPDNKQALIGRAIAGWRAIGAFEPEKALAQLARVAAREDLTVPELHRLATVYFKEANRKDLAVPLWKKVLAKDPEFAKKAGVDKVLEGAQ